MRRKQTSILVELLELLLAPFERYKPTQAEIDAFYKSWEWAELRYQALKKYGSRCMLCGASRVVVDHIKPIRTHWHLRLKFWNLQILCNLCNRAKGSRDRTDWRRRGT